MLRSGKTKTMVEELVFKPNEYVVIVVLNVVQYRYIHQMIRDLRGEEALAQCWFINIADVRFRLPGHRRSQVVVDHSVWEMEDNEENLEWLKTFLEKK